MKVTLPSTVKLMYQDYVNSHIQILSKSNQYLIKLNEVHKLFKISDIQVRNFRHSKRSDISRPPRPLGNLMFRNPLSYKADPLEESGTHNRDARGELTG